MPQTKPQALRILALDLSLTHTGYVFLDRTFDEYTQSRDPRVRAVAHGSIKTGARHKGESDWDWNHRRALSFINNLQRVVGASSPDVIVIEVSKKVFARKGEEATSGRYGAGAQYRAGQGLGRAMGWVDAAFVGWGRGITLVSYDIETAKRAITGNKTADKAKVRQFLEGVYGWDLKGWDPNEIDALSLGIGYLQNQFTERRDATRGLTGSTSSSRTASAPSIGTASGKSAPKRSAPSKPRASSGRATNPLVTLDAITPVVRATRKVSRPASGSPRSSGSGSTKTGGSKASSRGRSSRA